MKSKRLIVIEGLDGAGKSTQINLLRKYFDNSNISTEYLHFPMLNEGYYGQLIAEFLRGEFGSVETVHPKLVALLFAGDRMEHIGLVENWLDEGKVVILDRYVNSNIAFQCAKCRDVTEKNSLKSWILDVEYNKNQLPEPSLSLYLNVQISHIKKSLSKSREGQDRDYLNGKKDIHEDSILLQESVHDEYLKLIDEQNEFHSIKCEDEQGSPKSPAAIHHIIIEKLKDTQVLS